MLESRNDTENILEERIPNAFTLKMVKVEGGTFLFGSDGSSTTSEKKNLKIRVPEFHISPYTVTNAEFAIFLNDYGSDIVLKGVYKDKRVVSENKWGIEKIVSGWHATKGFEQHPVTNVTWFGAIAYCNWLSLKTEKAYRLPTESEWEFAAKGGSKNLGLQYAGSNKLKEIGWYLYNSYGQTEPVGLKLSNELGLYDMSGNVMEWCVDNFQRNYEKTPIDGSPFVSVVDKNVRMLRGGSWRNGSTACQVSKRLGSNANDWGNDIGFRLARY